MSFLQYYKTYCCIIFSDLFQYDYNVIGVDWSEGAKQFYPKAVANTRVVGAVIANLVRTLVNKAGLKLEDLHVIGHSLGAHVSGYVGRRVPGIARITGKQSNERVGNR